MLAALALLLLAQDGMTEAPGPALRVMSFNIRYGKADDGANSWPHRREQVVEVVETFDPDLVAVQEALDFQLDFLGERLDGYGATGGFREGGRKGEYTGILFRRSRLELVREGVFWLSETPEGVGSRGWDAALPRICAWAVLRDRSADRRFAVFATHLDHRGQESREQAARLIVERVAQLREPHVLLLGDFNFAPDTPAYATLRQAHFVDSWRELHGETDEEGTFHGFRGGAAGKRIDFVFVRGDRWMLRASGIDRTAREGRFPSDHYPVTAIVGWRPSSKPFDAARQTEKAETDGGGHP